MLFNDDQRDSPDKLDVFTKFKNVVNKIKKIAKMLPELEQALIQITWFLLGAIMLFSILSNEIISIILKIIDWLK
jgi:hypothetical protein